MVKRNAYLFIFIWLILIWGCLYPPERINRIEDKINKIEERYQQELGSLQSERGNLQTKLNEEQEKVKALQTELVSLRQQILELEKQNAELANLIAPATPGKRRAQPKFIRGKITAINPNTNILILSLGKQDAISPGAELDLFRDHQVIARLKIDVVETDWSSAHLLKVEDLKKFRVGDEISTQIK